MVDPAKRLHCRRRKPDLIAHVTAVFAAEKRNISLLDSVGVSDRGRPVRRSKRLEPYVGLVLSEQRLGCAPGPDFLHGSSPFSQILTPHGLPSNHALLLAQSGHCQNTDGTDGAVKPRRLL